MRLLLVARLVLSPLLFPLSIIYGAFCLIRRCLVSSKTKPSQKVISVGNIQVGGTGKTPIVMLLCELLGEKAVVISKNYRASAGVKDPVEVSLETDVKICGDEALEIKRKYSSVRVFSGPNKANTAEFASQKVSNESILIIDDGAQHIRLHRDIDLVVWDGSRHALDFLPFPMGIAREFWFTFLRGQRLDILNRSGGFLSSLFLPKNAITMEYQIKDIQGFKDQKSLCLISGIGNFGQLKNSLEKYLEDRGTQLSFIKGKDHDSFSWFKPNPDQVYVTTFKDLTKLENKIAREKLLVIESEFLLESKATFSNKLMDLLPGINSQDNGSGLK